MNILRGSQNYFRGWFPFAPPVFFIRYFNDATFRDPASTTPQRLAEEEGEDNEARKLRESPGLSERSSDKPVLGSPPNFGLFASTQ